MVLEAHVASWQRRQVAGFFMAMAEEALEVLAGGCGGVCQTQPGSVIPLAAAAGGHWKVST